jgi:VWFA-related protein
MPTKKIYMARSILSLSLCLFVAAIATHAQQNQKPKTEQTDDDVLRISTELVQTDVVVLDKQGKFVDGLKPEQFELKVDGKPQPITFFERVTAGSNSEESQLLAARGNTPSSTAKDSSTPPLKRGRTIIFFVDDLHMSIDSLARSRKLLRHFIDDEMGQDDQAAVASPSGRIGFLQQFTDNKTVLRAAVARLTYKQYSVNDLERPRMSEFQALQIDHYNPDVTNYFIDQLVSEEHISRESAEAAVRSRARQILSHAAVITTSTLVSLDGLMRSSARLPGRKLVFFLSDGFFLDNNNSDAQDRLKTITTTAARAGVIIYTMDARGLITGLPDASADVVVDLTGRLSRGTMGEVSAAQDALFTLADNTGGRAFVNSNALVPGLTRALAETSNYYLLAWRPDPETNRGGKFRRLEVSVAARPDLIVRARRGYLDKETKSAAKQSKDKVRPASAKTPDDELHAAFSDLLPRKGVPTSLSVNYMNLPEKGFLLIVTIQIPGDALTYEQAADKLTATVEIAGGVLSDQGKLLSSFKDNLSVGTKSTSEGSVGKHEVTYTSQVAIKPGLYQVRVASRDAQSKRTGSAMQWVEIPDLATGRLALSSIFLGEVKARQGEAKPGEDPIQDATQRADRRFAQASKLRFLTYIYNDARGATNNAAPDVVIQTQVLSDNKPVLTAPLRKVSTEGIADLSRLPYAADIPLSSIPAGRYVLQVTVVDRISKTSASQSINFEIE